MQPGDVRFQRRCLRGQLRAALSEARRCSGCALLQPPHLQYIKRPPLQSAHCLQQGNGENSQPLRYSPLNVLVSSSERCRTQSPRRETNARFLSVRISKTTGLRLTASNAQSEPRPSLPPPLTNLDFQAGVIGTQRPGQAADQTADQTAVPHSDGPTLHIQACTEHRASRMRGSQRRPGPLHEVLPRRPSGMRDSKHAEPVKTFAVGRLTRPCPSSRVPLTWPILRSA